MFVRRIAAFLFLACVFCQAQTPVPTTSIILTEYGYRTGPEIIDLTTIHFIGPDQLLVVLNQDSREPITLPPVTLLVFNSRTGALLRSKVVGEKKAGVMVIPGTDGFILRYGIQYFSYSTELNVIAERRASPYSFGQLASPDGRRFLVSTGERQTELLDGQTFEKLDAFTDVGGALLPANSDLLHITRSGGEFVLTIKEGAEERVIFRRRTDFAMGAEPFGDRRVVLSESGRLLIVDFSRGLEQQIEIPSRRSTDGHLSSLQLSKNGERLALQEWGYTFWNRLKNITDMKSNRPYNVEYITVFDASTGKVIFALKRDPRPQKSREAALSVEGDQVAVPRGSAVDIYRIP